MAELTYILLGLIIGSAAMFFLKKDKGTPREIEIELEKLRDQVRSLSEKESKIQNQQNEINTLHNYYYN